MMNLQVQIWRARDTETEYAVIRGRIVIATGQQISDPEIVAYLRSGADVTVHQIYGRRPWGKRRSRA